MERLPGFRDFYPEPLPHSDVSSIEGRNFLFARWREMARRYGFAEYDAPPLEPVELYTTKSGQEIVNQLYCFTDKGNREVSLRPEITPSLARLVAAHNRHYKKPLKWFSIPQLFRYERQQKGRLREHFQFNADIIGEPTPVAEAELIALLIDSLRAFGLTSEDFRIRLSSRGAWQQFLAQNQVPPEHHESFYLVIDKIERAPREQTEQQLKSFGLSLESVDAFIENGAPTPDLEQILANLSNRGLADYVRLDYRVIRGLAYYTGVVFEAFDQKGNFRAIAGGGRYDNLVKLISNNKVDLPALGFGMGDVVLFELLKDRGLLPPLAPGLTAYCLIEDEQLREASLSLIQTLRDANVQVDYSLTPLKPDKQFKRALESHAEYTVKLERNENGTLSARLRNLASREEKRLAPSEVAQAISRRA